MSSGGPDLFVVCKSCQSEVSPYITECPYCGARLRKRAPKLERGGRAPEPKARRRPPAPSLGRLRRGEMPGIRGDARPLVTAAVVVAGLLILVAGTSGLLALERLAVIGAFGDEWWRVFTAPLAHANSGFAFVALGAVALFGGLLERRHGHGVALGLMLLTGAGGMLAAAATAPGFPVLGANGMGLGLLAAWAVPPLRELRAGEEPEADLIGAGVMALVLVLVPAVVDEADWIAGAAGGLIGLAAGLPLARLRR